MEELRFSTVSKIYQFLQQQSAEREGVEELFQRIQREGKQVTGEVIGKTILERNQDNEQIIVRIRFNNLPDNPHDILFVDETDAA